MDTHSPDDVVFWHHLSDWNGSRRMFSTQTTASLTYADRSESMARTYTSRRNSDCGAGIFHGTFAQREGVLAQRTRRLRKLADAYAHRSNRLRHLP